MFLKMMWYCIMNMFVDSLLALLINEFINLMLLVYKGREETDLILTYNYFIIFLILCRVSVLLHIFQSIYFYIYTFYITILQNHYFTLSHYLLWYIYFGTCYYMYIFICHCFVLHTQCITEDSAISDPFSLSGYG